MYVFDNLKQNFFKIFLVSLLSSVVSSILFAAFFAFLMTYFSISPDYASLFSTLSYAFGCLFGALVLGFKVKEKGMLIGSALGLSVFVISLIIALAISESSISLVSLFHLLGCVLSGSIGGIFSVNKANSKNYNLGKYK